MTDLASLADLHDRLDALWITYLQHLDAYTTSQKALQQHMSAGFLSLARANFNARDGVTRHGKDFYHERAVATRRAVITAGDDDAAHLHVKVVHWEQPPADDASDRTVENAEMKDEKEPVQQPSPPATPGPEADDDDADGVSERNGVEPKASSDSSDHNPRDSKPKPSLHADPLRWFGILIPRELRSAQISFSAAVDETVIESANTARSMRETEATIRKLRKEIKRAEKAPQDTAS